MAQRPLHVRSRCLGCGIQLRVDPKAMAAALGPGASLIDRTDRCSVVGCQDPIYYEVSLPFRQSWIRLVRNSEMIELIEHEGAAAINAAQIRGARVKDLPEAGREAGGGGADLRQQIGGTADP